MNRASATAAEEVLAATRRFAAFVLILSAWAASGSPSAAANITQGAQLARQWCANCHVIGGNAPATIQQGPPSFQAIAQGGLSADQLRVFLSHPHGAMPDLSLTRAEIDDLIAYIKTLR